MSLNLVIRALKRLIGGSLEAYNQLKYDKERRAFDRIELDLGEARDKKEYPIYGDVIIVEEITGNADLYVNEKDSKRVDLNLSRKVYTDFWRIFITNTAQAGKVCNLLIGKEGCFDITETDYWLNLLKDKQDEAKIVLDGVKLGTDKIIAAAASAAKQDILKTVMDSIKAKTDGIIDQTLLATATLQNTMKGVMDTVYDKVNAAEILLKLPEQSREGLVLYLDLEEGSGTDAIDKSDIENHGTITGANWTDGKFGKALMFDGEDDYVEVVSSSGDELNPDSITIMAWVKADSLPSIAVDIVSKNNAYALKWRGGGKIEFHINTPTDGWQYILGTTNLSTDVWYFFAGTYNASTGEMKIYLNGSFENSDMHTTAEAINESEDNVLIGTRLLTEFHHGIIDEIRIYNHIKSVDEIKAHYDYGSMTRYKERKSSFETQKFLKTVLDGVKEGTDKIIASGATEAKQDSMRTVLDGVKAGTDKIIADAATAEMQKDVQESISIIPIDRTIKTTVGHPQSVTVEIKPPVGYIYEVLDIFLYALKPVGATTGVQEFTLYYYYPEWENPNFDIFKISAASILQWRYGYAFMADSAYPTTETAQILRPRGVFADNDTYLKIEYTNATDADQTNYVFIALVVKKIKVIRD